MMTIDGSFGEGGGQVLRSSLALSLVTGKPFRIEKIRAGRNKPGLMRQHLTAARAAAEVGRARIEGDHVGSTELSFTPRSLKPGSFRFAVGTAGSATLVLQTILPALILGDKPSELVLEGGTHNSHAPPFDFLEKSFLALVNKMGPQIDAKLEKPGFYPVGGGRFTVSITPTEKLLPLELLERGERVRLSCQALIARLPRHIAQREIDLLGNRLNIPEDDLHVVEIKRSNGTGNVVFCMAESNGLVEVFTGFGEKGVRAESVAESVCRETQAYLDAGAPVGAHLADQLLIPLSMAGGGRYRTVAPSLHTLTNIEVIKRFLDVEISTNQIDEKIYEIGIDRSQA